MTDFKDFMGVATPFILLALGWLVNSVRDSLKGLREEIKELVTKETCAAHRASLQRQLDEQAGRFRSRKTDTAEQAR